MPWDSHPWVLRRSGGDGHGCNVVADIDDMDIVNAIAKVRFNSAHAKRVQLQKLPGLECELLCLEPGQEFSAKGPCVYYVIAGAGVATSGAQSQDLAMGQLATCSDDAEHSLANTSEQRLICLSVS